MSEISKTIQISTIDQLSDELMVKNVFGYLSFQNRLIIRQVCPKSRRLSFANIDRLALMKRSLTGCSRCDLHQYQINHADIDKRLQYFCNFIQEMGTGLQHLTFDLKSSAYESNHSKEQTRL